MRAPTIPVLAACLSIMGAAAAAGGYSNLPPEEKERWDRIIEHEQLVGSSSIFECAEAIPETFKRRDEVLKGGGNWGAGAMSDVLYCQQKHFPVTSQQDCKGTMESFRRLSRSNPALAKTADFRAWLEEECSPAKLKEKPENTPWVDAAPRPVQASPPSARIVHPPIALPREAK